MCGGGTTTTTKNQKDTLFCFVLFFFLLALYCQVYIQSRNRNACFPVDFIALARLQKAFDLNAVRNGQ